MKILSLKLSGPAKCKRSISICWSCFNKLFS